MEISDVWDYGKFYLCLIFFKMGDFQPQFCIFEKMKKKNLIA